MRKQLPNISLGTVYRNLQKLVADEKLQILILGRSQHFDPLVGRHQHFICEVCDSVFDGIVDTENDLKPAKLPHEGFKVTSHQLAFYGTCKHCAFVTALRSANLTCKLSVAAIESGLVRWLTWLMSTFHLHS